MKLFLTLIISSMLLTSCTGQTKNMKTKAKNTPEVTKMLVAYKKQEHRLAFNGCEMTYNDKPFKLGITVKELINVLNDNYIFDDGFYIWKDIGITASIKDETHDLTKKVTYIYIYMNDPDWFDRNDKKSVKKFLQMTNTIKDYFLLKGMPMDKNMRVMDFIANSEFELNDFGVSNYGYELDYNCDGKKIGYRLKADGLWLHKGVGHLTYKDKPNPKNDNTFEMLYITEIEE